MKGDVTEWDWIAVLREHLPTRYCVDKAFIVDSRGNLSQQLDLVIFDKQYGPIVFHRHGATYIPAESVYAVFEVKQAKELDPSALFNVLKMARDAELYRIQKDPSHARRPREKRKAIAISPALRNEEHPGRTRLTVQRGRTRSRRAAILRGGHRTGSPRHIWPATSRLFLHCDAELRSCRADLPTFARGRTVW